MPIDTKKNIAGNTKLNPMNLALTCAQHMSEQCGIGWCLIDAHENLLTHGSAMHGIETQRLSFAVLRYKEQLDHLFITCEPLGKLFESTSLISNIVASNCTKISIALRLDEDLVDPNWRQWLSNWTGTVDYSTSSGIAYNLVAGASNVKRLNRPWVIAICASDMSNQPIQLADLRKEFGFIAYVINLVSQSRALVYDSTQTAMAQELPQENNIDELVEFFEISGTESLESILKYCANQGRCNVVIISDIKQLSELIKLDLVDEIVHHIVLSSPHEQHNMMSPTGLDLTNWNLISTDTVGNSVRMRLKKEKDVSFLYAHLDLRLN